MLLLSKVDANLLQYSRETVSENAVNLYLNGENNSGQRTRPFDLHNSQYANTIELSNNEYVSYHLSRDHSVITVYTLGNTAFGKTINIHLPCSSMNKQYTLTVQEIDEKLTISVILQDGLYLVMELPLDTIFSGKTSVGHDWLKVLNPYDFSIRRPHLLYPVSEDFYIAFLNDGGLLGLRKTRDSDLEPILFNDNSYLQSLTQMFSRKNGSKSEKAISCLVFAKKFLVVLTQSCHLKVWDLTTLHLVLDNDLSRNNLTEISSINGHEDPGNYMTLLNNWLVIYLPFGNGLFHIGTLALDATGKPNFSKINEVSANLSSSSIWTLVDMTLLKPLELATDASYLNLVVLWKSGMISKVQILNLMDEDLQLYEWIEATNRSLNDIEAEQDLNVNGDAERGLQNLKTRYSNEIFERAQQILSENHILKPAGELDSMDYLANLETVLRDLKNKADEVSSLTIYMDEILVVNCLQKYNHSVYKINSTLENVYYNIYAEVNDDELKRYLKTLHCFSATLSKDVLQNVSNGFIDIANGSMSKSLSLKEKFTDVYRSYLSSNFEVSNLKLLFDELNTFGVIPLLNNLIENHLRSHTAHARDFVDSLTVDNFTTVTIMESLFQMIALQKHFVLQVLLAFAFLDFDDEMFVNQLESLLDLHFRQSLILGLYQIDKTLFISELFNHTTKFRSGIQLHSYSEWFSFLSYTLSKLWEGPINSNPYFISFFDSYVIQHGIAGDEKITKTKLLLQNIGWPFYLRNNQTQEFMLAMMFFACEKYDEAYEFFHLHNYPESIANSLPECLRELGDENYKSMWSPLVSSMAVAYRHSKFEYELALLFTQAHSTELAYKCIKKSIEYSMREVEIEEPQDYKERQLKLYLNLLFHFDMFSEALDVLRFNHNTLSEEIRTTYYKSALEGTNQQGSFLAMLLNLCHSNDGSKLYLPTSDYQIIDNILVSHLQDESWESYKQLYSFRMMNKHDRAAAELIYQYLTLIASSLESRKKCYLIIVNVLSTFDNEQDQWLLNGCNIITLSELKFELANI